MLFIGINRPGKSHKLSIFFRSNDRNSSHSPLTHTKARTATNKKQINKQQISQTHSHVRGAGEKALENSFEML